MKHSAKYAMLGVITIAIYTTVALAGPTKGIPPFQSFGGGPDVINLGNLNVHYSIPVFSRAGRGGMNFSYALAYDSSVWTNTGSAWVPSANWGLTRDVPALVGVANVLTTVLHCRDINSGQTIYYNLYTFTDYVDWAGTVHGFSPYLKAHGDCDDLVNDNSPQTGVAWDGSGITMTVTSAPSATITLPDGRTFKPQLSTGSGSGPATDSNGNQITSSTSGSVTTFYDTLSATTAALTIDSTNPLSVLYKYTAPSGAVATVTVTYVSKSVQTNFGCAGISEYGPISNNLVDRISLPDGSYYQFTYEATPGGFRQGDWVHRFPQTPDGWNDLV